MNDMLRHQLVSDRMDRALEQAYAARVASRRRPRLREATAGLLVSVGLRLAPCREALLARVANTGPTT